MASSASTHASMFVLHSPEFDVCRLWADVVAKLFHSREYDGSHADSGWHEPDVGDIGSHRILDDTSSGGLPNYEVCDYSLDTNGDGEVGDGEDDLFEAIGGMFGAILSKDALYFMVTDASTRDLVKYAECDETVSGRR